MQNVNDLHFLLALCLFKW